MLSRIRVGEAPVCLGLVDMKGSCGQLGGRSGAREGGAGCRRAGPFSPHMVLQVEAAGVEGGEQRLSVTPRGCTALHGEQTDPGVEGPSLPSSVCCGDPPCTRSELRAGRFLLGHPTREMGCSAFRIPCRAGVKPRGAVVSLGTYFGCRCSREVLWGQTA